MCGIFGIISNENIDNRKLAGVSESIRHRGPDDEGFLLINETEKVSAGGNDTIKELNIPPVNTIEGGFKGCLIHRRLSIIDLTPSGHQPMPYADERYWLIFNGEVYNYIEIREELKAKGHNFRSTSDGEVILAAYAEWGPDCVKRFNGMWAFAIYDYNDKSLFVSRDRFGIKPLYYYHHDGLFLFASELKALKSYLGDRLSLNKEIIGLFAMNEISVYGDSDRSTFNEVKTLPAGHSLIYRNDQVNLRRYWKLETGDSSLSFEEHVIKIRETFEDAIRLRLRSDVEVGSCLSGGIDSSSIVSMGSAKLNKKFNTFSAVWPGARCDESDFVDIVNKKFECIPNKFTPDLTNFSELMKKVTWHQEIPVAGSSILAQWFVMERAAKKGIKVLLDGQGADEVLGGYPHYVVVYLNELFYKMQWRELLRNKKSLLEKGFGAKRFIRYQLNRFKKISRLSLPVNEEFHFSRGSFFNRLFTSNNLADYLREEIEVINLPSLLHFEDRNSMAHSVESRVPYLDYRLVELAFKIPASHKIKGSLTKVLLREAMKGIIPDEIFNRKDKVGFETPVEAEYFRKGSKFYKEAFDFIRESSLVKDKIVDAEKINSGNLLAAWSLAVFLNMWS